MANSQTQRLRKKNVSVRFLKGADFSHQGTHREPSELEFVPFPSYKGSAVNSHLEREKSGRKEWKGHGDCLGRNRGK